ncbi:hypothetical protein Nepgr_016186 [Nepenthes gracilis]|uniref:Uncharacterized protein n=1 Tax=Nepenthes gracilis TaxID=150966 RepID=A0AAD3SM89_NEPGR|nr:hypothetical protein Nepgr_016186 [Nepenthes gracilis]
MCLIGWDDTGRAVFGRHNMRAYTFVSILPAYGIPRMRRPFDTSYRVTESWGLTRTCDGGGGGRDWDYGGGWRSVERPLSLYLRGAQMVLKSDEPCETVEGGGVEEEEEEDDNRHTANEELARAKTKIFNSISALQALKQEVDLLKEAVQAGYGVDLDGGHGSEDLGPIQLRFQAVRNLLQTVDNELNN